MHENYCLEPTIDLHLSSCVRKEEFQMYCRTCAKELADQAVVCVGCGCAPKKDKKFCSGCGQPTNEAAEFCTSCGVKLTGLGLIGNINIPKVEQIDYKGIQKSYGRQIAIGIGLVICFGLLLSGVSAIWCVPVVGLIVALGKNWKAPIRPE